VPVAFVDDNAALHSTTVSGLRVLPPDRLEVLAEQYDIDRVILAMPSVSAPKIARLSRGLRAMGLKVQSLPSFAQLVGEEELIDNLSPVVPGQFLGRAQIDHRLLKADGAYRGKSILVSGAGGSIGSELCRQLINYAPARIVLYEVSEVALYNIDRELRERIEDSGIEIVPVLVGDASPEATASLIERLWGGPETLILISSDLSHYLSYREAQWSDRAAVDQVLELRPGLDHEQACGATPINGLLLAARKHDLQAHLLDLRNSGDTAGDRSRVVGYTSIAFCEAEPPSHARH